MSLRDVERAMIVFRYFCEKAGTFEDLVAEKAEGEVCLTVKIFGMGFHLPVLFLSSGETSY